MQPHKNSFLRKGPTEKFDFTVRTPKTPFIHSLSFISRTSHRESIFIHIFFVFRKKWPIPRVKWKLVQRISFCRKKEVLYTPPQTSKPSCYQEDKKNSLGKLSLPHCLQVLHKIEKGSYFLSQLKDMCGNKKYQEICFKQKFDQQGKGNLKNVTLAS